MSTMYLAIERGLVVVRHQGTAWYVHHALRDLQPTCVAVDPFVPEQVYCGTFGRGLWRSEDAGTTWKPIGDPGAVMEPYAGTGIRFAQLTALAVSSTERVGQYGVVYAGTEPTALFRSEDGGETWQELSTLQELPSAPTWSFPPRPFTHHVRCITPDPLVAGRLFVAIEAGALVQSSDSGAHWEDRTPDGPFDTHTLLMHPLAPDRLYAAAGDGLRSPERGYNESYDAGKTWHRSAERRRYHYLWGMAVDPADPDTVVISAAPDPQKAHHLRRTAYATVYRTSRGSVWHEAIDGLPGNEGLVVPVFATHPDEPHTFYLLSNTGLYRSSDAAQSWEALPISWQDEYRLQHQQALAISPL